MATIILTGELCYCCPVCDNDEIELGQYYCQICGESLDWQDDALGGIFNKK